MKYTCVDASNGMGYELKATNDREAILEAYDDMTRGFDVRTEHDFDIDAREGNTHCYIDKWADDAVEDDDPVASASISWNFELHSGDYNLKEIRVDLFDDTELTINDSEGFRKEITTHYQQL